MTEPREQDPFAKGKLKPIYACYSPHSKEYMSELGDFKGMLTRMVESTPDGYVIAFIEQRDHTKPEVDQILEMTKNGVSPKMAIARVVKGAEGDDTISAFARNLWQYTSDYTFARLSAVEDVWQQYPGRVALLLEEIDGQSKFNQERRDIIASRQTQQLYSGNLKGVAKENKASAFSVSNESNQRERRIRDRIRTELEDSSTAGVVTLFGDTHVTFYQDLVKEGYKNSSAFLLDRPETTPETYEYPLQEQLELKVKFGKGNEISDVEWIRAVFVNLTLRFYVPQGMNQDIVGAVNQGIAEAIPDDKAIKTLEQRIKREGFDLVLAEIASNILTK